MRPAAELEAVVRDSHRSGPSRRYFLVEETRPRPRRSPPPSGGASRSPHGPRGLIRRTSSSIRRCFVVRQGALGTGSRSGGSPARRESQPAALRGRRRCAERGGAGACPCGCASSGPAARDRPSALHRFSPTRRRPWSLPRGTTSAPAGRNVFLHREERGSAARLAELARVADLPPALRVERRAVQDHLRLARTGQLVVGRAVAEDREHTALRRRRLVPDEGRGARRGAGSPRTAPV